MSGQAGPPLDANGYLCSPVCNDERFQASPGAHSSLLLAQPAKGPSLIKAGKRAEGQRKSPLAVSPGQTLRTGLPPCFYDSSTRYLLNDG